MAPITVPDGGLSLPSFTVESKTNIKPSQVMQLDLAPGVLEEMLTSARQGGKGVKVSFGKTMVSYCVNGLFTPRFIANALFQEPPL